MERQILPVTTSLAAPLHVQSAALEAAANGIVITDAEGTIEWVNPAFTAMTGYSVGQGSGLGLSICKGIVESHGGRIAVASPARGAELAVILPLDALPFPTAPDEVETPPTAERRVLVVDDEPDVASVLIELLQADGHVVDAAADGREALAKIEAGSYDAVLSDVKMPGLDGPGLYREVARRHPELARRFTFVTGDTLDAGTARFLAESGLPSFAKPFDPDVTRRALARIALVAASPA